MFYYFYYDVQRDQAMSNMMAPEKLNGASASSKVLEVLFLIIKGWSGMVAWLVTIETLFFVQLVPFIKEHLRGQVLVDFALRSSCYQLNFIGP